MKCTMIIAVALHAAVNLASAQNTDCSNQVVNRTFAYSFSGFLNVPMFFGAPGIASPPGIGMVPTGGAGFITFLPHNKVDGQLTLAIGVLGLQQDMAFLNTSQYALTWDNSRTPPVCSGTVITNTGTTSGHFQLRVSQDGQQIEMIHIDAGLIVSLTGYQADNSKCNLSTLKGQYTYNARGWALSPQTPPLSFSANQLLAGYLPFAMNGAMEFNPNTFRFNNPVPGSGLVALSDTLSANGIIVPRTAAGWYKINPDCTGTMVLTDPNLGEDFQLELFVSKDRGSVYMVNTQTVTVPGMPTPLPMYILGMTANQTSNN